MKKKSNKLIWVILGLVLVLGIIVYMYINSTSSATDTNTNSSSSDTVTEVKTSTQTITKSISSSGEISSSQIETLSLNTNRYFKEIYVEKNDSVKSGENILMYSNGTYLEAPYDCVISEVSVPETGSICTSSNGIKIQSTESLNVTLNISESEISSVKVGQEAEIKVSALGDKAFTGTITKISDIGTYSSSGSTFSATVTFANDGTVKIGMSGDCTVILEKAEDVICVPKEAVQTANNQSYVVVVNSDGSTSNVNVETGISNDAYTEIKSGLTGTETVQMTVTTSSSNSNSFTRGSGGMMMVQDSGGPMVFNMPSGGQGTRGTN